MVSNQKQEQETEQRHERLRYFYSLKDIKTEFPTKCTYGNSTTGFPRCHCNDCLNAIYKIAEFSKSNVYMYKGDKVKIKWFCPLEHTMPIGIGHLEQDGFIEQMTFETAREVLTKVEA